MISKMRKTLNILFVVTLIVAAVGCATLGLKSNGSLKPYKTSKLDNGLNILYVNDEKLPYISTSLVIMSGFAADPKDQTGLTAAALELLNKGTLTKSAEQIAAEIEQMGAEYDANITADYSMVSLDGLAWQEDKILSILSELILKPKFDDQEINRYKSRTLAVVQQRLDQVSYLASEIFESFYYKNHPYGHRDIGTMADIKKLNKTSIQNQFGMIARPNNTWLVVVGKYSGDVEDRIEKYFGGWKNQAVAQTQYPTIEAFQGRKILLVNKPDAAQAEIRIGHKGTDRRDPAHVATTIANSILGQGFTSRLVDRIRDQLGLTYSISSSTDFRLQGSVFEIRTFTQSPKVGQTISEVFKVYDDFHKNGVTDNELKVAQKYMVGVFPSLVETAEKTAYNLIILRIFGVADDYLLDYQKNIAKATLAEVNSTIQRNYDPNNLKVVIVAPKDKVLSQLKGLGEVEVIEASAFLK